MTSSSPYRELNADLAPIKPLYFESGSKSYEPGRKYSGLHGKASILKWPYSI